MGSMMAGEIESTSSAERIRVTEWASVKAVTANSSGRTRRLIKTSITTKSTWSRPNTMCSTPCQT